MPTIICSYCQYVGSGAEDSDRIADVEEHEKTCPENPDYEEEDSVVKCEIQERDGRVMYKDTDGSWAILSNAMNDPDFIGYLYEDGCISPLSRIYNFESGGTQSMAYPKMGEYEVLTPTHVLFKIAGDKH